MPRYALTYSTFLGGTGRTRARRRLNAAVARPTSQLCWLQRTDPPQRPQPISVLKQQRRVRGQVHVQPDADRYGQQLHDHRGLGVSGNVITDNTGAGVDSDPTAIRSRQPGQRPCTARSRCPQTARSPTRRTTPPTAPTSRQPTASPTRSATAKADVLGRSQLHGNTGCHHEAPVNSVPAHRPRRRRSSGFSQPTAIASWCATIRHQRRAGDPERDQRHLTLAGTAGWRFPPRRHRRYDNDLRRYCRPSTPH